MSDTTNTQAGPLFGGFKIVRAIPMKAEIACDKGYRIGDASGGDDGYEVQYEDGYLSWSPKGVFENAYVGMMNDGEINPVHLEILRFFAWEHLPQQLQNISAPFAALAWRTAKCSKDGREASVAIRKLLEAKDAAVRACL